MIFIDRSLFPVPSIYSSSELAIVRKRREEFYSRPEENRTQERFSSSLSARVISDLRVQLKSLFKNKCAYCESIIGVSSAGDVDDFRPKHTSRGLNDDFSKDHYWWLAYDWNNVYLSCDYCNRYKSSWFPVEGKRADVGTKYPEIYQIEKALLVDPCHDNPEQHFIYKEDGTIDYLTPAGKITIDILKLNRSELLLERGKYISSLFSDFQEILRLWNQHERDRNAIRSIALRWESILNHSEVPYLGVQRYFLSRWLSEHLDLRSYLSKEIYNLNENDQNLKMFVEEQRVSSLIDRISQINIQTLEQEEREAVDELVNLDNIRHIYLEKLVLHNFKGFDDLVIEFNQKVPEKKEPWLLFLGENGVGKSSILKAIAMALCGNKYLKKLKLNPSEILKNGKDSGFVHLFLKGEKDYLRVEFDIHGIISSIENPVANIAGYGSTRLMANGKKIMPERTQLVRTRNLFDYSVSLINASEWLLNLEEGDFQRACSTLKLLMSLGDEQVIQRDIQIRKIFVQIDNVPVQVEYLSDGYQSLYSLVVDIMATFASEKVTYDVAEGVILIDELGTHLHPRWRMAVVSRLREAFPRIQFIVSTHEPLCLRGLNLGEVVVLSKKGKEKIVVMTELPNPDELRIDQILTSDFFGLSSTIDPRIEDMFEEYYNLLILDETERSDIQKNRLLELSEKVPKAKHLGDTLREEIVYYIVDELLAKKGRENSIKKTEDIKEEAVRRVESLWSTINKDNTSDDIH